MKRQPVAQRQRDDPVGDERDNGRHLHVAQSAQRAGADHLPAVEELEDRGHDQQLRGQRSHIRRRRKAGGDAPPPQPNHHPPAHPERQPPRPPPKPHPPPPPPPPPP